MSAATEIVAYAEDLALLGLSAREFLRAPVFRMIHHHCSQGDERLSALMPRFVATRH